MSGTQRTHYSVMGLSPDAPQSVIKAAYRALAKQYHPDGSGGSGDAGKFIELQESYKILSDEVSRAHYDWSLVDAGGVDASIIPDEESDAEINPDEIWSVKVVLKPEIQEIHKILKAYSPVLGNRFRLAVINGECDDDPTSYAADLDRVFFYRYFGDNPEVRLIARKFLEAGNRRAAKALNKAVKRGKFRDGRASQRLIAIFRRHLPTYDLKSESAGKPDEQTPQGNTEPSGGTYRSGKPVSASAFRPYWIALTASIFFSCSVTIVMGFTSARALAALFKNPLQYTPFLLSLVVMNTIFWLLAVSAHRTAVIRDIAFRRPESRQDVDVGSTYYRGKLFVGSKYFWRAVGFGVVASIVYAIVMGFTSTKAILALITNPLQYSPFLLSLIIINLVLWLLELSSHRAAIVKQIVLPQRRPSDVDSGGSHNADSIVAQIKAKSSSAFAYLVYSSATGFTLILAFVAIVTSSHALLWLVTTIVVFELLALSAHRNAELRSLSATIKAVDAEGKRIKTATTFQFIGSHQFWKAITLGLVATIAFAALMGFSSIATIAYLLKNPLQFSPFLGSVLVINSAALLLGMSAYRYARLKEILLYSAKTTSSKNTKSNSWEFSYLLRVLARIAPLRRYVFHPKTKAGIFAITIVVALSALVISWQEVVSGGYVRTLDQVTQLDLRQKKSQDRLLPEGELTPEAGSEPTEVEAEDEKLPQLDPSAIDEPTYEAAEEKLKPISPVLDTHDEKVDQPPQVNTYVTPSLETRKAKVDQGPLADTTVKSSPQPSESVTERKPGSIMDLFRGTAEPKKKLALVIGNAAYKTIPWLENPDDDARAMSEALSRLGFQVITVSDATMANMRLALLEFSRSLGQNADTALVYYSGHAVEIGSQNFLLPTDISAQSNDGIASNALSLGDVIRVLNEGIVSTRILILDACRDNPLGRTGNPGLAAVRAGSSTFIAYSTEPGTVANDGDGKTGNSPYTAALVAALKDPAPTIEETFRSVRAEVMRVTNNKQIPWESSSLTSAFSFRSGLAKSRAGQDQEIIDKVPIPSADGGGVSNLRPNSVAGRKQVYDRIVGDKEVSGSQNDP